MRKFAQIHLSVWNDDDFCELTADAQLLYFGLISHPTMNRAGVGTWHAGRLAALNSEWDRDAVERAALELQRSLFVEIDHDTDEFLVRSFLRHDGLLKQKNMATTMAREFAAVGSKRIRGVVVHELQRLHSEYPEWKGWESEEASKLLKKKGIDPSVDPSVDPMVDPSVKGSVDPSSDPSVDPSVKGEPKGSVDPRVDPSPTTATTTTPKPTGHKKGESREGVKGVRGTGETNTGSDSPPQDPIGPPYNLDELAAVFTASNSDPTRCDEHQGLAAWNVPPCRACQAKREAHEATQDIAAEAAKQTRREAINNCDLCDENGMRQTTGGLTRCTHPKTTTNTQARTAPPF